MGCKRHKRVLDDLLLFRAGKHTGEAGDRRRAGPEVMSLPAKGKDVERDWKNFPVSGKAHIYFLTVGDELLVNGGESGRFLPSEG